ncbi:MAG: hypothetical protein HYV03_06780 [Deltaproteobacteria bacterium]|nr:hypothetical protein [Deltaproteobacteria bacterium]
MPTDPVAAKLGMAALEASLKATPEAQAATAPTASPTDSPFQQVLSDMAGASETAAALGIHPGDLQLSTGQVNAISAEGITPQPEWLATGSQASGWDTVVDLLGEVNHGQMRMDQMLNELLYSGKQFSHQELLAIEAHLFQFMQINEIAVRMASEATSALKGIMNTQVQ